MQKANYQFFVLVFLLIVALCATAQTPSQRLSSLAPPTRFTDPDRASKLASAFPEIEQMMHEFAQRDRVPGIAYGIIIDGKLVYVRTQGLREVGNNAPVNENTVFRIASMTKSFTAAAILQLRDAGRLSLDDSADRYVPELRKLRLPTTDSRRITIRDLLSHSAGFPEDNPWGDQQLAATDAEFSAMLSREIPFSNTPGVAYEYSNLGFAILGRIVSNVSRMTYTRYVRERLLKPLGMTSTFFEASSVPKERLAHGYRWQDERWLEEPPLPHGAFGAMGGIFTSISDLSKWVAFMLDAWPPRDGVENGPLRRASRREMQQVARFNTATAVRDSNDNGLDLNASGYGYGLGTRQSCLFKLLVRHGGGLPGFGSSMSWLPDYGVGIVALGNLTYTGWGNVVNQVFQSLSRTGSLVPREVQPAPVLLERQAQITQLITQWDESLADNLAAMNLYLDESKPRRRAAIEKLVAQAGGNCRPEGTLLAENALRGVWRLRCTNSDLKVSITLAPTQPATVQFWKVAPLRREGSLAPPTVCQ